MNTRRNKKSMTALRKALVDLAKQHGPATVRQVFYLGVSGRLLGKSESEYKATCCRLLSEARLTGVLPWNVIVDHTRSFYRPNTHDGLDDAISDVASFYRRDMWSQASVHVEVWAEKATLIGALRQVTSHYDIGLYPCRGYPSLTFLHDCAEGLDEDKPTFIYYVGDYDATGTHISINVEERLREFAPRVDITFERLAVNKDQVTDWGLETRPPKKTDKRHARYGDDVACEVEAIPPERLRGLVRSAIEQHVDAALWRNLETIEASEREILRLLPDALECVGLN